MPKVNLTIWIEAPLEKVYAISKDNSRFPEFMKDVQSLTVVETDGNRIVSDYVGIVSAFGLKVKWRQEDLWDDSTHSCAFSQLKGDYDKLEGVWRFKEEKGGTRFDSDLEYEYKVPGLGIMVGQVIHGLVVKNIEGILAAIKARSESG
jgi:ribosome-associated toxin RatA of RatAB toxin-antitoxin module